MVLHACSLQPDLPIFPSVIPPHVISNGYVPPNNNNFVPHAHPPHYQHQYQHIFLAHPPTVVPSATAGLFPRAEANPAATMNFIRKIAPVNQKTKQNGPSQHQHASSAPPNFPNQRDIESRESTPASPPYPKAGNGLMSKLGPDDEDMEWLVDDNDFDAFSHSVFPGMGA